MPRIVGTRPAKASYAAVLAWHEQRRAHNPSTRAGRSADPADADSDTLEMAQLRKLQIDVRTRELKYEILAGQMIPADRHHRALAELAYNVRERIRGVPEAISKQLVGLDDYRTVYSRLLAAIDDSLVGVLSETAPAIVVDDETRALVQQLDT